MLALVAAAALAAAPTQDPAKTLQAVQAMYDQSCQVRAYGSYDDLCSALRQQLRDARRAEQKASRAGPPPASKPESETAAPVPAETPPAPPAPAVGR